MKMFVFEGSASNFGDDLNRWLWPRILPNVFDNNGDELFLGIGSILYDSHPKAAQKIVFGAGYAGYTAKPELDDTWTVYFVRGKKTCEILNLPMEKAVGDSGILIRTVDLPKYDKVHDVSFMPHFESAFNGSWEAICKRLGVNFVDPRWDVDVVLEHILSSRLVVSEAMHGIIVSDALRVPWVAIKPQDPNHHAKWLDWASVLGVSIDFCTLGPSNLLEWLMGRFWKQRRVIYQLRKQRGLLFKCGADAVLPGAVRALKNAAQKSGQLSSDAALDDVTAKMVQMVARFKQDYADRRRA